MNGEVVAIGLLVALAAAVVLLPARRELPDERGTRRAGAIGRGGASGARERADLDVGLLLTEVATLLRAGATPQRAWLRALERSGVSEGVEPGEDGVPPALRELAEAAPDGWMPARVRGRWVWNPPLPGRRAAGPPGGGDGRRRRRCPERWRRAG